MPRNLTRIGPCTLLADAFGHRGLPDALFYEFKYGLRFELGGDTYSSVPRFLQALDRARLIARSLFGEAHILSAAISYYGEKHRGSRERRICQQLKALGFSQSLGPADSVPQEDAQYLDKFGEDLYRHWHFVDGISLTTDVDTLLWAAISSEMQIRPKSRWANIHLLDLKAGTILHIYDDRGMDVVSVDPAPLIPLYETYRDWLLPYDRPKIDDTFMPLINKRQGSQR